MDLERHSHSVHIRLSARTLTYSFSPSCWLIFSQHDDGVLKMSILRKHSSRAWPSPVLTDSASLSPSSLIWGTLDATQVQRDEIHSLKDRRATPHGSKGMWGGAYRGAHFGKYKLPQLPRSPLSIVRNDEPQHSLRISKKKLPPTNIKTPSPYWRALIYLEKNKYRKKKWRKWQHMSYRISELLYIWTRGHCVPSVLPLPEQECWKSLFSAWVTTEYWLCGGVAE